MSESCVGASAAVTRQKAGVAAYARAAAGLTEAGAGGLNAPPAISPDEVIRPFLTCSDARLSQLAGAARISAGPGAAIDRNNPMQNEERWRRGCAMAAFLPRSGRSLTRLFWRG